MDSATSYVRNLMAGYRLPDISKLWRDNNEDDIDSRPQPKVPLLVRLEASLVHLQELALWIDPKSSMAAMGVVQIVYWYLACTSSTVLNLTAWACIIGFVYTTWVNRIWPEITVEKPAEDESAWTPVRPEVFSAPELVEFSRAMKEKSVQTFTYLREMRAQTPVKFCALACATFTVIGYLGAYVTALGLFYYSLMGFLTVPGFLRYLAQNHPDILSQLKSLACPLTIAEDVPDSPEPEPEVPPTTSSVTAVSAVYTKVQEQISSVVTHLTSVVASNGDNSADEDDLKEYLPDEEQVKQVLEEETLDNDHDESLEYSSLLVGLGPSMPDVDDEVDVGHHHQVPSLTSTASRSLTPTPATSQAVARTDVFEDEDDFLPTVDQHQLLLEELDRQDDDSNASFALGSHVSSSSEQTADFSMTFPAVDESDDLDRDDFEIFSGDELAEALIKK